MNLLADEVLADDALEVDEQRLAIPHLIAGPAISASGPG
jgi:hypothetical protein